MHIPCIQIYYLEDSTAEWIALEDEAVVVATGMGLVGRSEKGKSWPALLFWMSPKARELCGANTGFKKNGKKVYAVVFISDYYVALIRYKHCCIYKFNHCLPIHSLISLLACLLYYHTFGIFCCWGNLYVAQSGHAHLLLIPICSSIC